MRNQTIEKRRKKREGKREREKHPYGDRESERGRELLNACVPGF